MVVFGRLWLFSVNVTKSKIHGKTRGFRTFHETVRNHRNLLKSPLLYQLSYTSSASLWAGWRRGRSVVVESINVKHRLRPYGGDCWPGIAGYSCGDLKRMVALLRWWRW